MSITHGIRHPASGIMNVAKFITRIQDLSCVAYYLGEYYDLVTVDGLAFVLDMTRTSGGFAARVYDPSNWTDLARKTGPRAEFELSAVWAESGALQDMPRAEYIQACSVFYDLTRTS